MWESEAFIELYALSIPDHGGRDLAIGTKNSILDQLEDDILAWEERLGDEDDENDDAANEEGDDGGSNGVC